MATLKFGTPTKTANDYIAEIQDVVGNNCPITVEVIDGVLKNVIIDTQWKEGGTTAVETGEFVKMKVETADVDEEGNPVIVEIETDTPIYDYVEDYTEEELTQAEINAINTWAEQNVEA